MDRDCDSSHYEDKVLSNFSTPDSIKFAKFSNLSSSYLLEEFIQKTVDEAENSFQNQSSPYEKYSSILTEDEEKYDIDKENQQEEPPNIIEVEISEILIKEESNTQGNYLMEESLIDLQEIIDLIIPILAEFVIDNVIKNPETQSLE